ncbi:putative multicopper oxidase [Janibacter sp. HTCC2649]|uniref:multicopper oxidase family protein n=1 Tax=Janibacter sp. HTCC2649 TaxID=313589 RepID=UPI000066EBA7|nr:multicopper oxidase family protein [Janibacter sp. HTCC2649]EAP98719.1 putative multicopper oxidase [Janibacter sp. HTCC2649]
MPAISRRTVLLGSAGGLLTVGGLAACSTSSGTAVTSSSRAVETAERGRRAAGQRTVTARLAPRQATLDLGGPVVRSWAYGDGVPGPLLRATAGDRVVVTVDNALPESTSVHWHGVALRNDMDGVPGMTQNPIGANKQFTYDFTVPDPGTYFYHPHSGVQLDRGLYGVLVVDDPAEPGAYDAEWIVVLDDWVDGTGQTPDDVLAALRKGGAGAGGMDHGSMGGMPMGGLGGDMQSPLIGGAGDVAYPHYLINGRVPASPVTLSAKPGQRVRIRMINAASDTAFRVAVGGHRLTVTHSDGFPVATTETDALLVGMGERFDVLVTLGDGTFPLVASAEGKSGQGMALVRTAGGEAPSPNVKPTELRKHVVLGTQLRAAPQVALRSRQVDRKHDLVLGGSMRNYRWTINGKTFDDADPLGVRQGERVRLRLRNMSMMFHPMHVHGHTFGLRETGARKDTVIVRPMAAVEVDLDADNPGQWATHCHNIYHAEAGMMTTLSYRG